MSVPVATETHKEAYEAENTDCLALDIKGLQTMKRFLNWATTGSHCRIQASMLGCFCSHPQKPRSIPWHVWFCWEGDKKCRPRHNQPRCYQRRAHRMLATRQEKKKNPNHPYNSSPGLARKSPHPRKGDMSAPTTSAWTTRLETDTPTTSKENFLLTMIKNEILS